MSAPRVEPTGLTGYTASRVHFDVNGKWGGTRALVAHFRPDGGDAKDVLYLYILVGEYWEVGRQPDCDEPSAWEIARRLTEGLEAGADKRRLFDAISMVLEMQP